MSEASRLHLVARPCFQQDLEMVQLIYAHHVLTGAGTFEIVPPSLDQMVSRWGAIVERGWPFMVASPVDDLSRVMGFAYGAQFRERAAYAKSFEVSVYAAPTAQRMGVGAIVLAQTLVALRDQGALQAIAVIGDSANAASIGLHTKLGFRHVGTLKGVGEKFGRMYDVVIMQRGIAAPAPPA